MKKLFCEKCKRIVGVPNKLVNVAKCKICKRELVTIPRQEWLKVRHKYLIAQDYLVNRPLLDGKYYDQRLFTYISNLSSEELNQIRRDTANELRLYYIAIVQSISAEQELKIEHSDVTINAIKEFLGNFSYWLKVWIIEHTVICREISDEDVYIWNLLDQIKNIFNISNEMLFDKYWWADNWELIDQKAQSEFDEIIADTISIDIYIDSEDYPNTEYWYDIIPEINKKNNETPPNKTTLVMLFEKIRFVEHSTGLILGDILMADKSLLERWKLWKSFCDKLSENAFQYKLPQTTP